MLASFRFETVSSAIQSCLHSLYNFDFSGIQPRVRCWQGCAQTIHLAMLRRPPSISLTNAIAWVF